MFYLFLVVVENNLRLIIITLIKDDYMILINVLEEGISKVVN